jgi:hypothetical protein
MTVRGGGSDIDCDSDCDGDGDGDNDGKTALIPDPRSPHAHPVGAAANPAAHGHILSPPPSLHQGKSVGSIRQPPSIQTTPIRILQRLRWNFSRLAKAIRTKKNTSHLSWYHA